MRWALLLLLLGLAHSDLSEPERLIQTQHGLPDVEFKLNPSSLDTAPLRGLSSDCKGLEGITLLGITLLSIIKLSYFRNTKVSYTNILNQ